jgi:hypothetical protein
VRGGLHELIDRVTYGLADVLTDAHPPISLRSAVAEMAPRPALLITAAEVADEANAASAGHTNGLDAQPEEWEARVVSFLSSALHV